MESKKLEKPRENGTFSTVQGVMKPDEEGRRVLPPMKQWLVCRIRVQFHPNYKMVKIARQRVGSLPDLRIMTGIRQNHSL